MNHSILRQALVRQEMYNVIDLLNQGADQEQVMETFEKNVLYQNKHYQMLLMSSSGQTPEEWSKMTEMFKQQQLFQTPEAFQIYRLLQMYYQIDDEYDCGCNPSSE
jgi:hypothetical protein